MNVVWKFFVIFVATTTHKLNFEEMEELTGQLVSLLFIVAGMMVTPLIFISLDFWSGIRKAKKRGEKIMSNKMKRTMDKVSKYYNSILAMLVLDCIQMAGFIYWHLYFGGTAYTFPVFTLLAILFVAAVEIKSICEPADAKESAEMHAVTELAQQIIANKGDTAKLAEIIGNYLNKS